MRAAQTCISAFASLEQQTSVNSSAGAGRALSGVPARHLDLNMLNYRGDIQTAYLFNAFLSTRAQNILIVMTYADFWIQDSGVSRPGHR